jgi:hypothetical protein
MEETPVKETKATKRFFAVAALIETLSERDKDALKEMLTNRLPNPLRDKA